MMRSTKNARFEDQDFERTPSDKARETVLPRPAVVRTTVGDLIAAAVDTGGTGSVSQLLGSRSPLAKHLRQRLVFVSGDYAEKAWV